MSRSRFLPLPGPLRPASPAVRWLAFACPLAPGLGWPAAFALLDRLPAACPPETVILDLAGSSGAGDDEGAALCWLHEQLAAARSQLWLAAPRSLAPVLRDQGVESALGSGAIHPSRRAAVLAIVAARPGPGLVTSQGKSALAQPPVPLLPVPPVAGAGHPARPGDRPQAAAPHPAEEAAGPAAGQPPLAGLHPLRVEPRQRRGWWPVLARFNAGTG
jgi:hypothetical protein